MAGVVGVIGRVQRRGNDVSRLLYYLYGKGRRNEHKDPHLVAGWLPTAELEPPVRPGGQRDFRRLTGLLELPRALHRGSVPDGWVWHCTVRAAPGDKLPDGAMKRIAEELMHATGLSEHGFEDDGVPWIAVDHGDDHIHIVATLVRQDGRPVRLSNEYFRVGAVMRWAEREYVLRPGAQTDRTAPKRPSPAEQEKAVRAGLPEPARVMLRRAVEAAAASARAEHEFLGGLEARGVQVLLHSDANSAGPVGYAVRLPGDRAADGGPVWFGGGKLAADLTLPKLRRRWDCRPDGLGQLTGRNMSEPVARAVLHREVLRVARASRDEASFFSGLARAGLLVWPSPDAIPAWRSAGYSVSLPDLSGVDGKALWFGDSALGPELQLGQLRTGWQSGRPGAEPGPDEFGIADVERIYAHVADVAEWAAGELRGGTRNRAAIATAAADLVTAAADTDGGTELRRAADGFSRAARAQWGRVPGRTLGGKMLRTAAYLLAACRRRGDTAIRDVRIRLLRALAKLADALATLRFRQQRILQAAAAREAAAGLAACADAAWESPSLSRSPSLPVDIAFQVRAESRRPRSLSVSPGKRHRSPPSRNSPRLQDRGGRPGR